MKKFYKNVLWIFIVTVSTVILLFSREKLNENDLVLISGKLRSKPIEIIYGGDVPRYNYIFAIYDYTYSFKLGGCAYRMTDRKKILNLNEGEIVSFYAEKEIPLSKYREVYSISGNNIKLLSLSSYNRCKNQDTTLLLIILIVLDLYLVYRLFKGS